MADVVRTTSEPQLGAIRLAWWRERLEALDAGTPAPPEPRLRAAADQLVPRGIAGGDLAGLERGWLALFDALPWTSETMEAVWLRGNLLFALGARLLGSAGEEVHAAGGLWALVDAARHCSDGPSRDLLLAKARTFARGLAPARFPTPVRALTMLAALAARDCRGGEPFDEEGTAARAAVLLRHRLTGRLPPERGLTAASARG